MNSSLTSSNIECDMEDTGGKEYRPSTEIPGTSTAVPSWRDT